MRLFRWWFLWAVLFNVISWASSDLPHVVQSALSQVSEGHVGIIYTDLETNQTFSYQADRLFNPASVIKIPILIALYKEVEMNRISLSDRLTLEASDIQGGAGRIRYHQLGRQYTIKELARYMIVHSDNTATKMIIRHLTPPVLNQWFKRWGMNNTRLRTSNLLSKTSTNDMSPIDVHSLLMKVVRYDVLSPIHTAEVLSFLNQQKYKWGIPAQLPSRVHVYNKTGTLTAIRHDVGLVIDRQKAYILTVFTEQFRSQLESSAFIADISKRVLEWRE